MKKTIENVKIDILINKIFFVSVKMCNFPSIYLVYLKTRSDFKHLASSVYIYIYIYALYVLGKAKCNVFFLFVCHFETNCLATAPTKYVDS